MRFSLCWGAYMGSVDYLSGHVLRDLEELCVDLYKSPREKRATLVLVTLECRSCNLMEWAARLSINSPFCNTVCSMYVKKCVRVSIMPMETKALSIVCSTRAAVCINPVNHLL